MVLQQQLAIQTPGRSTTEVSHHINDVIHTANIHTGICHIFLQHTSASLILCENADPSVRTDLEQFMQRLVKDGDPAYQHDTEGPDDMAAHIRSILTTNSLTIPVTDGHSGLGTWQGIYLWEHRYQSHQRHLTVTVQGE